jgi:hypothetical protein
LGNKHLAYTKKDLKGYKDTYIRKLKLQTFNSFVYNKKCSLKFLQSDFTLTPDEHSSKCGTKWRLITHILMHAFLSVTIKQSQIKALFLYVVLLADIWGMENLWYQSFHKNVAIPKQSKKQSKAKHIL